MFVTDEQSRMSWFSPGSLEPLYKFELIGILTSLAVYNGLTLPFTFPLALYNKLLGRPVEQIQDIQDGWPALAKGLRDLATWEGNVENDFMRAYQFTVEAPGFTYSIDMQTGLSVKQDVDAEEPSMVDNSNRHQYIQDYINWLLYRSVRRQFEAFERGFRTCMKPQALSLLTGNPGLLKLIVEGSQVLDVAALRRSTRYEGYSAGSDVIKAFWSVVSSFRPAQVCKLLEFVTANDRVPVGGTRPIEFTIQRNGSGDDGVSFSPLLNSVPL